MFSPAPNPRTSRASTPVPQPSLGDLWRERVRRAVGLVVAFATLEDAPSDPAGEPFAEHPHRPAGRPVTRTPRRPGTVDERAHACASPLPTRRGRQARVTAHR